MADEEEGAAKSEDEMEIESEMTGDGDGNEDETEPEELFEVEEIVGMKKNVDGVKLYKVRWKNYSKAFDTWEPIENLESCLDMVEDFENVKEREKKKRSEERKRRMAIMAGRTSTEGAVVSPPPPPVLPPTVELSPPPCSSPTDSPSTTLKDTFWKDLEEGRINLFNTDMYSKVKGQGRASRPKSFKKLFSGREMDEEKSSNVEDGATWTETKKAPRNRVKKKVIKTPSKETKSKGKSTKSRGGKKKTVRKDSSVSSSDVSETSSDSSDIIMAQVISVSTPSPPVLSCVEDYSDDSSRDDTRYSSPADITGSLSDSPPLTPGAMSEDTGIGLDVSCCLSPAAHTAAVEHTTSSKKASGTGDSLSESGEPNNTGLEREFPSKTDSVSNIETMDSTGSKCGKKKYQSDLSDGQKVAEKKLKLDSDCVKSKQTKATPSKPLQKVTKPGTTINKSGKENMEKQVVNIFNGLSNVLSPQKQKSPVVHTVHRAEVKKDSTNQTQIVYHGNTSQSVGQTNSLAPKRREPISSPNYPQPLDTILNSSSLLSVLPDNKTSVDKAADLTFDIDLEDIDLDELEKQLTLSPTAQPADLTDEELKQAVIDGDYELVKRAFAARRVYDVEQGDDSGTTLLMQAVLRNYDDIAELLVCNGAKINAQQKNGNTALMMATEQAHICTVALLIEMGAGVNLQQTSGETALMKAVKRGHKQITRYLLESGANFSLLTYSGHSAITYAKMLRLPQLEEIIIDHMSRLTVEFDRQVAITLNNTAQIISALFPIQTFPLAESDKFVITFKNELEPITPGVGFLLFIAHARVTSHEMKCRFYGPCAVTSVVLNGVKQPSLTEEANFVLSCHPVLPGKNELCIHTEPAFSSKAKLVVCAYKAQLIQ